MRMTFHRQQRASLFRLDARAILAVSASLAGVAQAQDAANSPSRYIQFYGNVDIGLSYQTHGNAFSPDLPTNVNAFLTKYNGSPTGSVASNGLSFSTIGARSSLPLSADLSGLFQLEASFNPASGSIANGPGSVAANNGAAPANYTSFGDSNKAGQFLNGSAFLGLESKTYGRLTIGRNSTLMNDNVCRNDALYCAPAFSYVGYFGGPAGIGDTEDRFMDGTVKYTGTFGAVRVGALYQAPKFSATSGSGALGSAYQLNIGSTIGAFSVDAIVARKKDGIFLVSPLTAAQVVGITAPGSATYGLPADKTVNGIVSDNTAFGLFGKYDAGALKLFGGYEHVRQTNPASPLANGTETIGGYRIVAINVAFPNPKLTQYFWLGARYSLNERWDVAGAYYDAEQGSYRSGTSCSDASSGQCSGRYSALGLVVDYKLAETGFMKGFDVYGGLTRSSASGGVANGYLNTMNLSTMVGIRYVF